MKNLYRNYSLSINLAGLWLASWVLQTVAQIQLGEDFWEWTKSTMENWQSEFLQLFTFVVLTAKFIHKGSHESKDSQDRLEEKVDAIMEEQGLSVVKASINEKYE